MYQPLNHHIAASALSDDIRFVGLLNKRFTMLIKTNGGVPNGTPKRYNNRRHTHGKEDTCVVND